MGHTIDKKKLIISIVAALALGGGIYLFVLNQDFVEAFQIYQLGGYTTGLEYGLGRTGDLIASLVNLSDEKALAQSNGQAESAPVLLYHGIPSKANGDYDVALHEFKEQMIALKRDGWQTITLDDFYSFKKGEITLPGKSFLLTFDDGRKDSYYAVDPVLRSLGFNAVMFAITEAAALPDSTYYLEADELQRMERTGRWEIESHGQAASRPVPLDGAGNTGHFLRDRVWLPHENRLETEAEAEERIREDLNQSKAYLEELLDKPVIGFAFPFGDFGYASSNFEEAKKVTLAAASETYPLSFYQADTSLYGSRFPAEYSEPGENSFFIGRIELHPGWSDEKLVRVMNAVSAKSLPYQSDFSKPEEWLITWGKVNFDNDLQMKADTASSGTGSMAVLDGSRLWQDYAFKTRVQNFQGSNLYLIFRFQDDNNYAACNFGRDLVHIEETINGERGVIKGVATTLPFTGNWEVEIRVRNRHVECLYNGRVVVQTDFLNPALETGGIGLKGWDVEVGRSKLIVRDISVGDNP